MRIFGYLTLFLTLVAFSSSPVIAQELDKEAVEKIVSEYIKNNPETLVESLENYRMVQERQMREGASEKIKENIDALTAADLPSVGPQDADVTVVEFYDYNCGYCKRALPDLVNLLEEDDSLRFVFHEMPILSASSRIVALWSLASHKQDKFFEYHSALMNHRGSKPESLLRKIGEDLGMDVEKLKEDANSDEVKQMLENSSRIAREIGIRGTPAFIVNGTLYPGYLGKDGLKRAIEQARQDAS